MRRIQVLVSALGVLGILAAGMAMIVAQSFASKAQLVQIVKPDAAEAALFGDSAGTPIGSPQEMIISDAKAFLPGEGKDGAKLVNDDYLKKNGIYPLQLQTVRFVSNIVLLVGGGLGVLGIAIGWFLRRRLLAKPA